MGIHPIMENQMEKSTENEMDIGIIWGYWRDYWYCGLRFLIEC